MRNSSSHGGSLEGSACLDAWRCHFRDVPASVISPSHDDCGPSVAEQLHALRATMPLATGRLDFPFSEPELIGVLKDLPANRAPGPDGLTYELLRVDDAVLRSALLCLFELIRYWAVVPSVWKTAVVKPLHIRFGRRFHKLPSHQPFML